jgi:cytochrome c
VDDINNSTEGKNTMLKTTLAILVTMLPSLALANGDIAAGEKTFKKCAACHTVTEGGKNGVGPNLYGIVTKGIAADKEYKYSSALVDYSKTNPMWTDALLDAWLADPKKLVSGTKMAVKVDKEQERADLIAYLKSLGSK